ncbi:DmsE family decaheme c-type cytochrome [Paludibaculum fermentans]|uniref:DmsE family decaheme c-type cytochrome n=1 Tax=Paludibaculum fermentans TaxID=1473598 RepID=UPI003EBA8071
MAGNSWWIRLLATAAQISLGAATSLAASQYVGSAACKTCHPGLSVDFYRNPHYKTIASGKEPPEKTGCEGCHGPGSEHVAAKGDKSKISAFSLMQPKQVVDTCLQCHAESLGRANIRRSSHTQASVACNSCHSIHKSKTQKALLAKEQREVCYGCHGNVRAQFSQPFKHRVNEGFMNCSDCHNPHGANAASWSMGARPRMVDTALNNEEPCLKCHTDKRGPFAFEHPAVRVDGCSSCHVPHGTANARMLKRPVVFTVCLECHNGAGTFGRDADGIQLTPPTHNMADPRFRNCTLCHIRIHGSNADQRFLR